jgi:hypothetical protein
MSYAVDTDVLSATATGPGPVPDLESNALYLSVISLMERVLQLADLKHSAGTPSSR